MTIATFPQTSLGAAATIVVDQVAPSGVQRISCPDDETWHALRRQDITASVAAALLGAGDPEDQHAYVTPYQLYMLAIGAIEPEPIDDEGPILRGWLMEEPAVRLLRRRNPNWMLRHNAGDARVYYRDPAARIGCTPDAIVNDPQRGLGIVQIKSVEASIFRKKWKNDDGDIEPPLWIAVQAIVEATLVGARWAAVAPIVVGHGVEMPLIDIPIKAGIMARLRAAVAEFWRRVEAGEPYDPDFGRDGKLIANLYRDDDGSETDIAATDDLFQKLELREHFLAVEKAARAAEEARATIDAELRFLLKNAVRGRLPDGRIIEAKTTRVKAKTIEPYSFRAVKIKEAKAS
ncbi:putative phage-related endonuclease [Methylosinus sp. sav-2]|uniref:YqaJ viral recombinase family protein n=1 Tax=Methylosinus sp. sav-2 TaxID=2485168 RepID=UPI000479FA60|nr:YqaJ viral recombinase family protein [Methylosinus sp. sav-2]TDX61965.1 putative phage-related endonuclease [Methylosinus sp. sav-2]